MAFIVKALGAGNLAGGGPFDLYTVPDGRSALVTSVRLVNASATDSVSVSLYVRPSGSSTPRLIAKPKSSMSAGGFLLVEDVVTLGKGDTVQVTASGTAPSIGYMISGMERD